jgi:hypothetical protein
MCVAGGGGPFPDREAAGARSRPLNLHLMLRLRMSGAIPPLSLAWSGPWPDFAFEQDCVRGSNRSVAFKNRLLVTQYSIQHFFRNLEKGLSVVQFSRLLPHSILTDLCDKLQGRSCWIKGLRLVFSVNTRVIWIRNGKSPSVTQSWCPTSVWWLRVSCPEGDGLRTECLGECSDLKEEDYLKHIENYMLGERVEFAISVDNEGYG